MAGEEYRQDIDNQKALDRRILRFREGFYLEK